jgi:hypothetical protein
LRDGKKRLEADLLLALSLISLTVGLFFYWGTHVFVGARMFFEAFPVLILMSSRGISKTPIILSRLNGFLNIRSVKRYVSYSLGFFTLFAFVFAFPRWVKPAHTDAFYRVFVKNFAGVTHRINDTIERLPIGRSLVIMKFLFKPQDFFPDGWWGSGFLYNDPKLQNRIIYAQDRGLANIDLVRRYPDRECFIFIGTLDKGMLVPLELRADQLQYGEPVVFRAPSKDFLNLVEAPQELFRIYSTGFRMYLDDVYKRYHFYDIDVARLTQLSRQDKEDGEMAAAAFHLEAALQIENDPFVRSQLLGQLAFLYFKSGRPIEAKRIYDRLAEAHDPPVYDVFPEKGF